MFQEVLDMTDITYRQPEKDAVRQKVLQYAVESLTNNRSQACCVERNYVRSLYIRDIFIIEPKE